MTTRKTVNNDPSIIGKKFGRLTVIGFSETVSGGCKQIAWDCKCDCGNVVYGKRPRAIKNGTLKSCGCLKKEQDRHNLGESRITHGMTDTRLYSIWCSMKRRCYNTHDAAYPHYGGKGVKVCNEWLDFEVFYDWAIRNGYADDLTIERIDIDKDYCPENCKWIPLGEQARNRTTTKWVDYDGKRMSLAEAAELAKLPYKEVHLRIKNGWSVYDALHTPLQYNPDNLHQKCVELGLNYHTIYNRVYSLGWSEERALNTPIKGKGANQTSYS